jgi:hypothetical protein
VAADFQLAPPPAAAAGFDLRPGDSHIVKALWADRRPAVAATVTA